MRKFSCRFTLVVIASESATAKPKSPRIVKCAKVGIGTRGGKETSQKPAEVVAFNVQPAKTKNPVFAKR